jgi:hypothetical protein
MGRRTWGSIFWLPDTLAFWCLYRLKCGFVLIADFFSLRLKMTPAPSLLYFLQHVRSSCHTFTKEIRISLETEITVVHWRVLAEHTTLPQTKHFYITHAFVYQSSKHSFLQRQQKSRIFLSFSILKPPITFSRLTLPPPAYKTLNICFLNIKYRVSHPKTSGFVMANQCDDYKRTTDQGRFQSNLGSTTNFRLH